MTNSYSRRSAVTGREFDPMTLPRFMDIPTFMRAPLAHDLSTVDIALVGVPFDGGVTNRAGARHGPREVRSQSSFMRRYNVSTRSNPFDQCSIADAGDVHILHPFDLAQAVCEIEQFFGHIRTQRVLPVSVGGDHSITYPVLKALAHAGPVGLFHIDAHTDTWGPIWGSKYHHGAPFRLAVEEGLIDPKRSVQVGIRGGQNFMDGIEFSLASGMRVFFMDEVAEVGISAVLEEARRIIGARPMYLSFDVDALDPAFAPGTGTPEAGGLTTHEGQRLVRGMKGMHIIGGDVVEVAPPFDPSGNTALVGATLMFEILCVAAESFVRFGGRSGLP
jgi:guanidinopropionase